MSDSFLNKTQFVAIAGEFPQDGRDGVTDHTQNLPGQRGLPPRPLSQPSSLPGEGARDGVADQDAPRIPGPAPPPDQSLIFLPTDQDLQANIPTLITAGVAGRGGPRLQKSRACRSSA